MNLLVSNFGEEKVGKFIIVFFFKAPALLLLAELLLLARPLRSKS